MPSANKRRIVILHGLSADSSSDWYINVADHFSALGCETLIPNLPGTYAPNLNRWAKAIQALLESNGWKADEDLCLIGHSTGCMAALRFIESLPDQTRLGPAILVAGFPAALFHPNVPVLVARDPRPKQIKHKLPNLLAVHSTNDWRVPIGPNSTWLEKELGAEIFTIENAGHFIKRHGWTDWTKELYEKADDFLGV